MRKKKKTIKKFFFVQGKAELAVLMGVILFCIVLGGGLLSVFKNYDSVYIPNKSLGICCDSGDGANCHPLVNPPPTITFKSPELGTASYGLLKSNITIADCAKHLKDSGQVGTNNEPLIYDTSNELSLRGVNETCNGQPLDSNWDTLADYRSGTKTCFKIPNDQVVYACKYHCYPATGHAAGCDQNATDYYGDGTTVYDVYFRVNDMTVPPFAGAPTGVPDIIKNCQGAINPNDNRSNQCLSPSAPLQHRLSPVPYISHPSLQLHTFPFGVTGTECPQQWVRPWCKPAIYMYPPTKEDVTVKIAPEGQIKKVIPDYSPNGWQVVASPDGKLDYQNKNYDYLYYAASIPDELIPAQKTGYVVEYNKLSDLFTSILPQLGFNDKEGKDFSEYWLKALPKRNYYFVSVIPSSVLNTIAPLYFNPQPQTIIRATLNFEGLDEKMDVTAPTLTKIERKGFTVFEWGGMVKQDPTHPFTCLE